jgi:hypothetical protein
MQPQLRTAGDLRAFLAEVLVGIRDGSIDANKANSISKVAAQINQSMATEVATKLKLKDLGQEAAGEMLIGPVETTIQPCPPKLVEPAASSSPVDVVKSNAVVPHVDADKIWCEQCESAVAVSHALGCKSRFCKAKAAA